MKQLNIINKLLIRIIQEDFFVADLLQNFVDVLLLIV
jgi:hypothetical protein